MFLLSMLLVVLCPGILMSQGRIDVDNASIEVFPKTVTVQVGEQWRDHKEHTIEVQVYNEAGDIIPHKNSADYVPDRLIYEWSVSDTAGINLQGVGPISQLYRNINLRKVVGLRPGLYSIEVAVYRLSGGKPARNKILKATVYVQVRQDPYGFWTDDPRTLPSTLPWRDEVKIFIYPMDNSRSNQIYEVHIGDTIPIQAMVKTFAVRKNEAYIGQIINPEISWGFMKETIITPTNTQGHFELLSEQGASQGLLIPTWPGPVSITATFRNQTTSRTLMVRQ